MRRAPSSAKAEPSTECEGRTSTAAAGEGTSGRSFVVSLDAIVCCREVLKLGGAFGRILILVGVIQEGELAVRQTRFLESGACKVSGGSDEALQK